MAESASTPAKVCIACGKDVSQLPRQRDQAGRYMCQPCFEAAKAKAAASKPPTPGAPPTGPTPPTGAKPPKGAKHPAIPAVGADAGEGSLGGEGILAGMASQVVAKPMETCGGCGAAIAKDAVVCTMCGWNRASGRKIRVKVELAKEEKEPKAGKKGRGGQGFSFGPGALFLTMAVPLGGLAIGAVYEPALAMVYVLVAAITMLGVFIWALVGMFQDEVWKGIVGFFCGLYTLYWVLVECDSSMLKTAYVVAILATIGSYAFQYSLASP